MHQYLQVIPPHHVIITSLKLYKIQTPFWKENKKLSPMGIHSQSDSNIQYHDFNNGDALTFKDKYTALLQQELQNPYWTGAYMIPS